MEFNKSVLEMMQSGGCPYCGKNGLKSTASHISRKHGVSPDEVREEFGINYSEPLCTPEHSQKCSDILRSIKAIEKLELGRTRDARESRRACAAQGMENKHKWLFSDRRLEIFRDTMATPEARANLSESAKIACTRRIRSENGTFV